MFREAFIRGVVEGFYGEPWGDDDRLALFGWMEEWGLNTYFYAPKDDLKHRAIWREPYDHQELQRLGRLVDACRSRRLEFIYGLSPGLTIEYADRNDRERLKERLQQMLAVDARHFALLFDDIPDAMSAADQERFSSIAAAQCEVANEVFRWLRSQNEGSRFLFCPTPYCERMVAAGIGGEGYLEILGMELDPAIDILWTGPEIVSAEIPVESILSLTKRLRRPPLIWDNLHANDYDLRRHYCGPYAGREPELRNRVRGIVMNPNNEFLMNYVPLRTFSAYLAAESPWDSRTAYEDAIEEWRAEYETVRGERLDFETLCLLGDCYYLPHREGDHAERMYGLIRDLLAARPEEWGDGYDEFRRYFARVMRGFEGLTELRSRELFYAWCRRVWELKEELQLIAEGLEHRRHHADSAEGFASAFHLPGTYRGGLVAKLQHLLKPDPHGRFHRNLEPPLKGGSS